MIGNFFRSSRENSANHFFLRDLILIFDFPSFTKYPIQNAYILYIPTIFIRLLKLFWYIIATVLGNTEWLENEFIVTIYLVTACSSCLGPSVFYGQSVAKGGVPVYAIVRDYQDAWNTIDVVYHTFYPYNRGKQVCVGKH